MSDKVVLAVEAVQLGGLATARVATLPPLLQAILVHRHEVAFAIVGGSEASLAPLALWVVTLVWLDVGQDVLPIHK